MEVQFLNSVYKALIVNFNWTQPPGRSHIAISSKHPVSWGLERLFVVGPVSSVGRVLDFTVHIRVMGSLSSFPLSLFLPKKYQKVQGRMVKANCSMVLYMLLQSMSIFVREMATDNWMSPHGLSVIWPVNRACLHDYKRVPYLFHVWLWLHCIYHIDVIAQTSCPIKV